MARKVATRRELVASIIAQGRANSTGSTLLQAAIAERLDLKSSEYKCADLMLSQCDDCTPGRLAELTGLSTGAITGVIDRLERAGLLVREHDPDDRRRVLLRLTQTRTSELQALFAPHARGVEQLCGNFTVAELAVVLRFMREMQRVTRSAAEQLRARSRAPESERRPATLERERNVGGDGPRAGAGSSRGARASVRPK